MSRFLKSPKNAYLHTCTIASRCQARRNIPLNKIRTEIDHELGQAVGRVLSLEAQETVWKRMCIRLQTRIHYIAVTCHGPGTHKGNL